MKKYLVCLSCLVLILFAMSANAATTRYVDDDDLTCSGNSPCYSHPQDAVNAANPGDTILVYPGIYDSRYFQCPWPPNCSCSDNYSPALIVYKDGLTIKSVEGPANTVIQATHTCWSNAIAVQNSTAGGLIGISGWSPNAVVIVANNVTIEGFTFHRPYNCSPNIYNCFYNTAGVFIGSKGAGYPDFLGCANGATIKDNVFSDVWHAVYIWHSQNNLIKGNIVQALGDITTHWAAISSYDGDSNEKIGYGNLSDSNNIAQNNISDKGIALGAWPPPTWTSNAGSEVCSNTTTQVGVTYSHGPVIIGCNTGGFWEYNTDNVLRITGITYTGDTLASIGTVTLGAQLGYDGSSDGSGVPVVFSIDEGDIASVDTSVGGTASTTTTLSPGIYKVEAKVHVCGECNFKDTQYLVVYDPSGGFVTGGGWFDSPPGAYMPLPGAIIPMPGTIVTPADVSINPGYWHPANERGGGISQITSTKPDSAGGRGSLDQFLPSPTTPSPKTDFEIFAEDTVYVDGEGLRATNGGFGLLTELNYLSFDWYRDGTSTAPSHLTPALRLWVWDPDAGTYGTSSLLIWEGVYNDYPSSGGPVPTDTWISEDILTDNFWRVPQWINGEWAGIGYCNSYPNECFIFNRGLNEWSLGPNTVVIGINVGLGSGWDGSYQSFVDFITIGFNGDSITYNFEPVAPLTGKATFGFVSKYQKGTTVPTGTTEFQFKVANLNFHSSSYDWLVVTGSNYARFKGAGTINGMNAPTAEPYKFMLWAGDGTSDNGEDTFRIKIWYEENDAEIIIYDNGMDQVIGGGSIVVHSK